MIEAIIETECFWHQLSKTPNSTTFAENNETLNVCKYQCDGLNKKCNRHISYDSFPKYEAAK